MPDLERIRSTLARIAEPVALLESLFDSAPVALQIFEASGQSLLVNRAFVDLFGSEPSPHYNVLRDKIAAQRGLLELVRRAFAGETLETPPIWYDPSEHGQCSEKARNRVAVSASFLPLKDNAGAVTHVAAIYKDLTADWVQRDQLAEERELLAAILDQVGEGIVMADAAGTLRLANRAAQALGARVGTRVGEGKGSLLDKDGQPVPRSQHPLLRALRGETVEVLVQPEGSSRTLSVVALPLRRADGSLRGAVANFRDETERANREAQEKQTALFRERFIGILGHDLRSPLSAILAGAQLIARQPDSGDPARAAADRIRSSAGRMARMIAELLDFAQARLGGGITLHRTATDLGEIARTVRDEVLEANPARNIALDVEGNVRGSFDSDRTARLISNLLENAVAYAPTEDRIDLHLAGGAALVEIAVENAGPSIPAAEKTGIFEPFHRGSSAGDSKGLGLGLYIVQQIARAHGGDVRLDGGNGRTVFRATLHR